MSTVPRFLNCFSLSSNRVHKDAPAGFSEQETAEQRARCSVTPSWSLTSHCAFKTARARGKLARLLFDSLILLTGNGKSHGGPVSRQAGESLIALTPAPATFAFLPIP